MKRIGLFAAAAVIALALGNLFPGVDVGKLQPVQVVSVRRDGERYLVATDTGETGRGNDIGDAIAAMKRSASGEIFLDTADYFLLDKDCMEILKAACDILRPGTEVCLIDGNPDLEAAGQFLSVHEPNRTLAQCAAERSQIPILKIREGRMELIGQIH